ncbi:MAG TPA: DNA-binding domain-containing protein [Ferrovibrio sp.]|uniref:HvfC/BufC N-terminal domain-containing protein n=1 Tax=Ferrovibrio sp. TaxID=1917215 RepID=UPI002ED0027D
MTMLSALQAEFSAFLLQGADDRLLAARVRQPAQGETAERLAVYGNAYRERLRETLARDYPSLLRLIGQTRFAALAYDYIAARPSKHPNIRWFGARLAAFMAEQPRWRDDVTAWDMAVFEWSIGLAFDAAEAETLQVADLAAIPAQDWAALRFRLHPGLQLLQLSHAVPDWWLAAQETDEAIEPPPPRPLAPDERHWAIWRAADGVRFRPLEADEAGAIFALRDGGDFGALCALLAERHGPEQAAIPAAGLLRLWVETGWIAGLA